MSNKTTLGRSQRQVSHPSIVDINMSIHMRICTSCNSTDKTHGRKKNKKWNAHIVINTAKIILQVSSCRSQEAL